MALTLQFASEELRSDKDVVKAAVLVNPSVLPYASPRLRNDAEFAAEIMNEAPEDIPKLVQYLPQAVREEYERDPDAF